ncbi:hypothetical protein [Streptomyces sp. NPDC017993]|uniref:hypothetical protein n=1 Tax=Streptomyces sp. NPDC017993 TaxID=3365027 RepID=UPI0037ADE254
MPELSKVLYATDGTDFQGAVKYHYSLALKRAAKFLVIFVPLFVLNFVLRLGYLLPLQIVGFLGAVITLIVFSSHVSWIRRCARVFRSYPLEFRGPVDKVRIDSRKFLLGFGEEGGGDRPRLMALAPMGRGGRPADFPHGIWFAGDDAFGGAAIVAGSGELLFLQPSDWGRTAEERTNAGEERAEKARRAGIKGRVVLR